MYSKVTQNKIEKIYKNVKVRLVFSSDKLRQTFTYKDFYPSYLNSKIVYNFACASCNASYVGQAHRHSQPRLMNALVRIKSLCTSS